MNRLETLVQLSHEFGSDDYVKGGGGNSSAKDADTLWVKPSGRTMRELAAEHFVAMDRKQLGTLFEMAPPADPTAREALVKDRMLAAVKAGSTGRPSVEAPLHHTFGAAFVVHTHPALVNGMTCSRKGREACRRLFPEALWIEYVDPGYTLCMEVRRRIQAYAAEHGREPEAVFLQNHGVFVAGSTAESIRASYSGILGTLKNEYRKAGVPMTLQMSRAPSPGTVEKVTRQVRSIPAMDGLGQICGGGHFTIAFGPLTPDHIVYMKAFPMIGEPTAEAIAGFRDGYGFVPRVIASRDGVFGVGASEKSAALALEMARDGALVEQLADAFGGVQYMERKSVEFIDRWEVEAYRRTVAG